MALLEPTDTLTTRRQHRDDGSDDEEGIIRKNIPTSLLQVK